ncbi:hypothetical protein PCE1_001498 [Barthelona sp. PCE]
MSVHFDDFNAIKLLPEDTEKHTLSLQQNAEKFLLESSSFSTDVGTIVDLLDEFYVFVERARLTTIGLRNRIDNFDQHKAMQREELNRVLQQKEDELKKLEIEHQILHDTYRTQQQFESRLSNNRV